MRRSGTSHISATNRYKAWAAHGEKNAAGNPYGR